MWSRARWIYFCYAPYALCVTASICSLCMCVRVCACVRIRLYTNKFGPESLEYCTSFNCHLHSGRIVTFWILTACRTHSSHCSLLPVTRLCQCQGLPVSPRSGTFVRPYDCSFSQLAVRTHHSNIVTFICFIFLPNNIAVQTSNQKFKVVIRYCMSSPKTKTPQTKAQ